MANLTNKQLVVQSLKSLYKARIKALFQLKAIRHKKKELSLSEKQVLKSLEGIKNKMDWEINNNSKSLGDKN